MASAWNEDRGLDSCLGPAQGRREFLKQAGILPAALLACDGATGAEGGSAPASLPQIRLGSYSISRLICGANPFNAGSHLSVFVNRQMREYYTPEQILKTLRRCEEVGINCWQSGLANIDLYRRLRDEGSQMHFLAIAAGDPESIGALARGGCIGIAHHGETSDQLFKSGKLDAMHDYLKRVRDAGLLVGVSTHMPAVVDAVESKGWDIDYYMTCVYERHRSQEDLERLLGRRRFRWAKSTCRSIRRECSKPSARRSGPVWHSRFSLPADCPNVLNGSKKPSAAPSNPSNPRTESSSAFTTNIRTNRPKMPTSPGDLE